MIHLITSVRNTPGDPVIFLLFPCRKMEEILRQMNSYLYIERSEEKSILVLVSFLLLLLLFALALVVSFIIIRWSCTHSLQQAFYLSLMMNRRRLLSVVFFFCVSSNHRRKSSSAKKTNQRKDSRLDFLFSRYISVVAK